jgi:hypothetical protein
MILVAGAPGEAALTSKLDDLTGTKINWCTDQINER